MWEVEDAVVVHKVPEGQGGVRIRAGATLPDLEGLVALEAHEDRGDRGDRDDRADLEAQADRTAVGAAALEARTLLGADRGGWDLTLSSLVRSYRAFFGPSPGPRRGDPARPYIAAPRPFAASASPSLESRAL